MLRITSKLYADGVSTSQPHAAVSITVKAIVQVHTQSIRPLEAAAIAYDVAGVKKGRALQGAYLFDCGTGRALG